MKFPIRWKLAQTAELKWWESYLRHKPVESYLSWKKGYWSDFLVNIDITINRSERVLDAGCGPAGLFIILPDNKVDAIDPLIGAYESKLEHFSKDNYPWVTFHEVALENFESTIDFDTVFCLNAINHVADLQNSLQKLEKLVKPGGKLVLSVDAHNNNMIKKIFQTIPGDILHPHQYNLREYLQMVENTGLEVGASWLIKRELIFSYYVLVAHKTKKV